ncbi:MAG: cell wall-binding repeat-containing protein [Mogibacterium sp.]|nr:cell wall-binding repeat-containing protein [Mogibacterium sp.]
MRPKRLLAILLTICMTTGLFAVAAYAANEENLEAQPEGTVVEETIGEEALAPEEEVQAPAEAEAPTVGDGEEAGEDEEPIDLAALIAAAKKKPGSFTAAPAEVGYQDGVTEYSIDYTLTYALSPEVTEWLRGCVKEGDTADNTITLKFTSDSKVTLEEPASFSSDLFEASEITVGDHEVQVTGTLKSGLTDAAFTSGKTIAVQFTGKLPVASFAKNGKLTSSATLSVTMPSGTVTCRASSLQAQMVVKEANNIRLWGADRYATSRAIADQLLTVYGKETYDTVVLASGENFPDALSGGYLAYLNEAPLILVNKGSQTAVLNYLDKVLDDGGKVYLLGGTVSVNADIETKLNKAGYEVERLWGATRYETNLAILEEINTFGSHTKYLVCSGKNFPDALSASSIPQPILLVGDKITADQSRFLQDNNAEACEIIGGTAAITLPMEYSLGGNYFDDEFTVMTARAAMGSTRFETSAMIARNYFGSNSRVDNIVIAYAANFPDGLSGGPLAMALGAPLVIADGSNLNYLTEIYGELNSKYTVTCGGQAGIKDADIRTVIGDQYAQIKDDY